MKVCFIYYTVATLKIGLKFIYELLQLNCNLRNSKLKLQWKPLNVITLGQRETDNIN
jgi:hypothetical protein